MNWFIGERRKKVHATRLDRLDYGSPRNSNLCIKADGDHAKMKNESVLRVTETK